MAADYSANNDSSTAFGDEPHVLLAGLLANFDAASAREIMELYSKSTALLLARLKSAISQETIPVEEVRAIAHELKGASSMASLTQMESLSKRLSEEIKQSNWQAVRDVSDKLHAALGALDAAYQSWINSQKL